MRLSLPLLFFLMPAAAWAEAPSWEAIQGANWTPGSVRDHAQAGRVQVSSATISGIDCYRGEAKAAVSLTALLEVAADIPSTVDWSTAGLRESELLHREGNLLQYYQYLDVPGWTFASDRFWFLEARIEQAGDTATVRWRRLPEGGPHGERFKQVQQANPSAIEPPVNVGGWVFRVDGDQTQVRYHICSDTGGALPTAVQSAATRRTLPDTVGDLVREAQRRQAGGR